VSSSSQEEEEEDSSFLSFSKFKNLVESSTPGQNPDYFRYVEEVVLAVVNLAIHWVNIKQQVST